MNQISNAALFSLAKYCTKLESLSIAGKLNFNSKNIAYQNRKRRKKAKAKANRDKKKTKKGYVWVYSVKETLI